MPGYANADNKYGLTPYIVGQTLGDGCNYSSIQAAIDDAFAAGGGVVGIRSGTYIENLTLRAGVDLYGFDVDGRLPSPLAKVLIQGNHTFAVAVGFGAQLSQYITFSALAGDAFTVQAAGGGAQAILAMKFCGVEAFTNPGQRCVVLDATAGGGAQFSTDNTNLNSSGHCFEGIGAGSQAAFISLGNCNSQSGDVYEATAGGNTFTGEYTTLNGAIYIFNGVNGGNCDIFHSRTFSAQEVGIFPAGTGSLNIFHSTVGCNAASGFWVDGIAGCSASFGDVVFTSSATSIGPAVTVTKQNWQPYAETAAAAIGSNRGTASFDSAAFSVTEGFVQLNGGGAAVTSMPTDSGTAVPNIAGQIQIVGGPGVTTEATGASTIQINSVTFTDVGGVTTVAANSGSFCSNVGLSAITLPAAPQEGDLCEFAISNGLGFIVTANAGQTLRLGNLTGTTATSTAFGDALILRFRASISEWHAMSIVGNWIVA